jgi:hypothetical protein
MVSTYECNRGGAGAIWDQTATEFGGVLRELPDGTQDKLSERSVSLARSQCGILYEDGHLAFYQRSSGY